MAFKVNYGLERAERNRAKQAKKEAKAQAKKATMEQDAAPAGVGSAQDGEFAAGEPGDVPAKE